MSKRLAYLFIIALILNACSNTKYLPQNQKLYLGGEVKIADKNNTTKKEASALTDELSALTGQNLMAPF